MTGSDHDAVVPVGASNPVSRDGEGGSEVHEVKPSPPTEHKASPSISAREAQAETAELVAELREHVRAPRTTAHDLMMRAADLITRLVSDKAQLEGERDAIVQALRFRGALSDPGPVSWAVAVAIDTQRARAERAEAERDALKAERDELLAAEERSAGHAATKVLVSIGSHSYGVHVNVASALQRAEADLSALKQRVAEVLEPFASTSVLLPNGVIVGLERFHFARAAELHASLTQEKGK